MAGLNGLATVIFSEMTAYGVPPMRIRDCHVIEAPEMCSNHQEATDGKLHSIQEKLTMWHTASGDSLIAQINTRLVTEHLSCHQLA